MSKFSRIIATVLLLAAVTGLTACQSQKPKAVFLPESYNDELLTVLPEDWQFLEDWQTADDVPRLLLGYGESSLEPLGFSRSWSCTVPGTDEISSYIACGMHPLEAQADLPQLTYDEQETALLIWQAEPAEVSVTAYAYDVWQQRTCGNTLPDEILHTQLELSEAGSFNLLADEHSYVYVIDAKWQTEGEPLGGYAEWAFYVE